MFDKNDFSGAEKLFGDDKGAQSVTRVASCVADYVRVAEVDAVGGGGVNFVRP